MEKHPLNLNHNIFFLVVHNFSLFHLISFNSFIFPTPSMNPFRCSQITQAFYYNCNREAKTLFQCFMGLRIKWIFLNKGRLFHDTNTSPAPHHKHTHAHTHIKYSSYLRSNKIVNCFETIYSVSITWYGLIVLEVNRRKQYFRIFHNFHWESFSEHSI